MTSVTSVRLTDSVRRSIVSDLIKGRFDKRRDALVDMYADLAREAYETLFSKKERDLISSLPKDWLKGKSSITVMFGKGGSYVCLEYNGSNGNHNRLEGMTNRKFEEKELPIPYCAHGHTPWIVEGKDHPLRKRYIEVSKFDSELQKDHDRLKDEIWRALNSATTTSALLKIWPEIEPTLKKYTAVEIRNLPAPILTGLNEKLGLKKAA